MKRLFCGFLIVLLGIFLFVEGIYFEWIAENSNLMQNLILRKKFFSEISLILSYFFLITGIGVIFLAIRKMNREYKEKCRQQESGAERAVEDWGR